VTGSIFRDLARVLKPAGLLLFHDGGNPHHPATAERLRRRHREYELGEGAPDAPSGGGGGGGGGAGPAERLRIVQRPATCGGPRSRPRRAAGGRAAAGPARRSGPTTSPARPSIRPTATPWRARPIRG
jgi:hypothetical protein